MTLQINTTKLIESLQEKSRECTEIAKRTDKNRDYSSTEMMVSLIYMIQADTFMAVARLIRESLEDIS
jgi:hypothetical protein